MSTVEKDTNRRSPLADTTQAAEFLGCSRATVYAEMDRGRLSWCKVAGCRKIPWAELEAYIRRNTHGAHGATE